VSTSEGSQGSKQVAKNEDDVENYLGNGAIADWASEGLEVMDGEGYAANAVLTIHGAEKTTIEASVHLNGRIGPLNKDIINQTFEVPAGEEYSIPIKLDVALDLHEKQLEYTTKILGSITAYHLETGETFTQLVDVRYLAYNNGDKTFEVLDHETREKLYPYGFTTEEGQAMVRKLIAETPEGEFIEAIGPGIAVRTELSVQ